jgi:hypothetical protein
VYARVLKQHHNTHTHPESTHANTNTHFFVHEAQSRGAIKQRGAIHIRAKNKLDTRPHSAAVVAAAAHRLSLFSPSNKTRRALSKFNEICERMPAHTADCFAIRCREESRTFSPWPLNIFRNKRKQKQSFH